MSLDRATRQKLRKRLMAGLRGVAVELVNQAKVRATRHVDTGEYRNSITFAEKPGFVLFGLPANAKNASLELGFRPHFVPLKHIETWMRRHQVGMAKTTVYSTRTRRRSRRTVMRATGIYVGGRNSRLDYGPGGARGERVFGRRRVFQTWRTLGQQSRYIAPGKVGFSVIRWTVATRLRAVAVTAFRQGYQRGR